METPQRSALEEGEKYKSRGGVLSFTSFFPYQYSLPSHEELEGLVCWSFECSRQRTTPILVKGKPESHFAKEEVELEEVKVCCQME